MATANFTKDGNQKTIEKLYCSAELTGGIHNQLIFISVLNICLSFTAFLGNTLILVALHKNTSLHPPSKLLFLNLAASDLCVGIIAEPLAVLYWVSALNKRWNICRYAFAAAHFTSYILCAASLLTLTAISVDRLLALLLRLRYRQVVTMKRTYLSVTVFWVVSIVGATMRFWKVFLLTWYGYTVLSLCLITSIFCYAKIFLTLRHPQAQVQEPVHQEQQNQAIPLNITRYRKAVSSALWVQLTLVVCYLPHDIVVAYRTLIGLSSSSYFAMQCALTLIYINSSLNPFLYCFKIREVRQAVKDAIRQLCCSSG